MNFRHAEILTRAREAGRVSVHDLARDFGVTVQTVRRDLAELCETGQLARVHGGAVLPSGTNNIGYEDRRLLNAEAKERIGRAAAALIPNGASVFLDIGTTPEAVAQGLLRHEGLMVVTNNINVAGVLSANAGAEILLAGGLLRRSDGGLVGDVTADFVRQFKVDVAVIAASALDEDGDVLDFDFREVRVAQAVMAKARRTVLVAESSKFGRTAPVRMGDVGDFGVFVTDAPVPARFRAVAERAGTQIVLA